MPLQFNPEKCTPKTICCATGEAYDPVDPCSEADEIFDSATCSCVGIPVGQTCYFAQDSSGSAGSGTWPFSFNLDSWQGPGTEGTVEFSYRTTFFSESGPSGTGPLIPDTFIISGSSFSANTGPVLVGAEGASIFFPKKASDDIFEVTVIGGGPSPEPWNEQSRWSFSVRYTCVPLD